MWALIHMKYTGATILTWFEEKMALQKVNRGKTNCLAASSLFGFISMVAAVNPFILKCG